jgi:hypothetical protein
MVDFCRVQRPPGLIPSSMIGLESLTGELDEFGFDDFLNGDSIFALSVLTCMSSWGTRTGCSVCLLGFKVCVKGFVKFSCINYRTKAPVCILQAYAVHLLFCLFVCCVYVVWTCRFVPLQIPRSQILSFLWICTKAWKCVWVFLKDLFLALSSDWRHYRAADGDVRLCNQMLFWDL